MSKWSDSNIPPDQRGYGYAWQKMRNRLFKEQPLCVECDKQGIATIAQELDHIVPKAQGGTDDESNLQFLCIPCHTAKTLAERSQSSTSHPLWLMPSRIPVHIIVGPPCAGKVAYMHMTAAPGDIKISLDDCMREIDPDWVPYSVTRKDRLSLALRNRNAQLGALATASARCAWFIVASPCLAERKWWETKLAGRVILIDPGIAACKAEAMNRRWPRALPHIDEWYARARANDWEAPRPPKPPRPRIADDGWPIRA